MDNYFNYFTEIEEHFQRRRGTLLILSPLDWALMETWKDAGIPLEAVLRGIDTTFEKWERRPSRSRKVNGLAFCAQEVLASVEEMKEAAVGAAPSKEKTESGLEQASVVEYLRRNATELEKLNLPSAAQTLAAETAVNLRSLAESLAGDAPIGMEDLERQGIRAACSVSGRVRICCVLLCVTRSTRFGRSKSSSLRPHTSPVRSP